MNTIDVFAPITKREKDPVTGYVTVYGKMTGADLDLDEQRMDPTWLSKAVPDWFASGANVRQMHKPDAVGKGIELTQVDDDWYLKTLVVDRDAIAKVDADILTGYSISVRNPRIVKDASAPNGRIVGGMIPETSLVDRPCLPTAKFLLAKMVGDELTIAAEWVTKAEDEPGELIQEDTMITKLANVVDLVKAAQADDAPADEKAAVAELRKALGIDSIDTKIDTKIEEAITKAVEPLATKTEVATAEDLKKVAEEVAKVASDGAKNTVELAKVATTVLTSGPVRIPTPQDLVKSAKNTETLNKAAEYRRLASQVFDREQSEAYITLASQLEATL